LRVDGRLDIVRLRTSDELTAAALTDIDPSYVFFPHWSWKIPAEIYDRFECVIFHMTDLPYGRGGSPLQNLVARGHEKTQLTALRCSEPLDAGPVYMKRELALLGTAEEILMRAGALTAAMIVEIALERPQPQPQQGEATVFTRRKPEDGWLGAATTLAEAYDLIRMLDGEGYPRAFADLGPFRLEFERAGRHPDEILADVRIRLREHS
jgi:methionyl-tRNA formyltransferase